MVLGESPGAIETSENDDKGGDRRKGSEPEAQTQTRAYSSAPAECHQAGMWTQHC